MDEEDLAGVYVRHKDTVHELVSMFEKLDPSNPECGVSQADVEEWIDAHKRTVVSRTRADEDIMNAVMNPCSKSKIIDNEFSDEEIATEKISWAKAADAYSTLNDVCQKPAMSLVTGRNAVFCIPLFCKNEKNAPSKQTFTRCSRKPLSPTRISSLVKRNGSDEAGWSVSIHGESSGIGW